MSHENLPDLPEPDRRSQQRRKAAEVARANFTRHRRWIDAHGVSRPASEHPLYDTWKHARARCHQARHERYADYGGRGIRLYSEWVDDPVAFFEWVRVNLGPRPRGASLDRIDNDRGYLPGNLKWSTAAQQASNRRSCKSDIGSACDDCPQPLLCGDRLACPLDALPWDAARVALNRHRSMWPEGTSGRRDEDDGDDLRSQ